LKQPSEILHINTREARIHQEVNNTGKIYGNKKIIDSLAIALQMNNN
jgi:hypothetical protein